MKHLFSRKTLQRDWLGNVRGDVLSGLVVALAIIYLLPRLTKVVPSPLVAILVLTVLSIAFAWDVRRVGDLGALPSSLTVFLWPQVAWNLETLRIILPYSVGLAAVGLLESLMTAQIVDDLTDTPSDKFIPRAPLWS